MFYINCKLLITLTANTVTCNREYACQHSFFCCKKQDFTFWRSGCDAASQSPYGMGYQNGLFIFSGITRRNLVVYNLTQNACLNVVIYLKTQWYWERGGTRVSREVAIWSITDCRWRLEVCVCTVITVSSAFVLNRGCGQHQKKVSWFIAQ